MKIRIEKKKNNLVTSRLKGNVVKSANLCFLFMSVNGHWYIKSDYYNTLLPK